MKAQRRSLPQLFAALLAISCASANAVVTSITRQGTDVVLSWPSSPGQQFIVQFRETVDTNSVWTTLTNGLSAGGGTNITTFVHAGVLPEGGQQMQAEGGAMAQRMQLSPEELAELRAKRKAEAEAAIAWLTAQLYEAVAKAQAWREEVAKNPALLQAAREQAATASPATLDSGSGSCGFYRVLHTPTWSLDLTGYSFDGPTFIPVDFGDYMDRVHDIVVLLNGQPVPQAVFMPYVSQGQTNWGMGIYFDLIANGSYQIQLQSTVLLNDRIGDDSQYVVLSDRLTSVAVDNEVTFTNADDIIQGNSYTFKAQTKNQDTDWSIEIYDAWDNYVNGASGHTYNGQIEWTWDLRDIWGERRDDLDYDPYLLPYITFDASGSGLAAGQATRRMPDPAPWPNVGGWIISYADRQYLDAGTNYTGGDTYYQDGINNLVGGPALWDIPVTKIPLKFGTNVYTQTQRNDSWSNLKGVMYSEARYRNFYYYGHGGPNVIGADIHTFDSSNYVTGGISLSGSKAFLTSQSVSNELTFNKWGGARPYRFAYLDGCNTANGNWPGAFGVPKTTNSLSWYTSTTTNPSRRRPSAFVGWTVTVGGKGWGTVDKFWECRGFWMGNWSVDFLDYELVDALDDACRFSEWIDINRFWQTIRVFGYRTLRFDEYNTKGSWPP